MILRGYKHVLALIFRKMYYIFIFFWQMDNFYTGKHLLSIF